MSFNVPSQNNVKTRRDKITIILSNAFIGELCKKIPISKKVCNKSPTESHLKTMSKLAAIKLHLTLITNPYLTYYLLHRKTNATVLIPGVQVSHPRALVTCMFVISWTSIDLFTATHICIKKIC